MESIAIWVLLIGLVLIAGVSKRLRNTVITLPMLYTLFGLGAGLLFFDNLEIAMPFLAGKAMGGEDVIFNLLGLVILATVLLHMFSEVRIGGSLLGEK